MKEEKKKGNRTGFSTGACAAAAAKGALLALLHRRKAEQVEIALPLGEKVLFQISECLIDSDSARCGVVKDAGDDPDVTHGALIQCAVSFIPEPGVVRLEAGEGVGTVTQPGLGIEVGEPDITRVPRKMITRAIEEAAGPVLKEKGARVVISVPGGESLAKKTELFRLGVVGGIGILGTTGIVRPYSTSAFRAGISLAVGSARQRGYSHLVITTGGMSEKFARKWIQLPEGAFVQMGDFVGFALQECVKKKIERVTISGMIGKLSKMAMGKMMTHAAGSEVDTDFLSQLAESSDASADVVEQIKKANTARHVAEIVQSHGLNSFFDLLSLKVCEAAGRHVKGALSIECLMTDFEGNVIGRALRNKE
ncbi:MAG: cobalt-precorrin-5B (C(1))-methyltransferase [Nitrospiria bacterium]